MTAAESYVCTIVCENLETYRKYYNRYRYHKQYNISFTSGFMRMQITDKMQALFDLNCGVFPAMIDNRTKHRKVLNYFPGIIRKVHLTNKPINVK